MGKLPLFLVADQILPLLDASIDTLAPASDPGVVTLDQVADRLDAVVALSPGGHAELTLADGTVLLAERGPAKGNPAGLSQVDAGAIADCASCYVSEKKTDVDRLRVTGELASDADITLEDVHLVVKGGPARRVRWDVLRLR